jgi:hypothetical protein
MALQGKANPGKAVLTVSLGALCAFASFALKGFD